MKKIDLIIPCFNEGKIIKETYTIIYDAIKRLNYDFRFFLIDDGSSDNTRDKIRKLAKKNSNISYIFLSRNFGKEIAVTAALDAMDADACIILDADLQDPPELIATFLEEWEKGDYDAVYGQRISRNGETFLKRSTAHVFYRLLNLFSKVDLPKDTGDFWLLDRRAVEELKKLRETHRYMKGLFSWIGFKKKGVPYHRKPRFGGKTKYNYIKLINLSVEAFTGYSLVPLKLITVIGFVVSIMAMLFGSFILLKALFFGVDVRGYPSLIVMLSFLSGIQLMSIGILGEYIGRIFNESKKRSLYIIDEQSN